jgi:hypothetical protein
MTSFPNKNATSFKGSHGRWCGHGHNNIWRCDDHAPKLNKNNGGIYENKNKSSSSKESKMIAIDVTWKYIDHKYVILLNI